MDGTSRYLEGRIDTIEDTLERLIDKIDDLTKPKYSLFFQSFGVMVVVFGAIGTYFYLPLRSDHDALANNVKNNYVEEKVINKSNDQQAALLGNRIDSLGNNLGNRMNGVDERLKKTETTQDFIRNSIIVRSEHEQHWKSEADMTGLLSKRIDNLEAMVFQNRGNDGRKN